MQQKLCSRGSGCFLPEERSDPACCPPVCPSSSAPGQPPFRCPRCGEHQRFRSLASLRAHLEHQHSYLPPDAPPPHREGFSITGKPPDPSTASILWCDMSLPSARQRHHARSLSDSRDASSYSQSYHGGSARRRTQSVGVGTQDEEEEDEDEDEEEEETEDEEEEEEEEEDRGEDGDGGRNEDVKMSDKKSNAACHHHLNHHHHPLTPLETDPDLELVERTWLSGLQTAAASAAVRRRLASVLRAADSSMQRRLAQVSSELAHTDTQLLCQRAHSQHLAQQRQQVADKERSLSRQVDVAVMVIAALREQLNASENELERREREVLTIQKFLAAATRQETCGKVRIQHFIENLLSRIALAERLLEYYQGNGSPQQNNHYKYQQRTDNGPHKFTKSRSAGGHLSSSGLHPTRSRSSSQFGVHHHHQHHHQHHHRRPPPAPAFSRASGEREREPRDQREQREQREQRLAQSSRLFCRPEHRDDIWNQQRPRSAGYQL